MNERYPQFISRSLLLWWTVWLIVSFALNLQLDGGRPIANTVTMQWTLEAALAGLMLAWPVLRLSQATPAYPTFSTTGDLVALLAVLQMIIWPVGLMRVYWTADQTTALIVAFFAYGIMTGAVIDAARRRGAAGRLVGMAACVVLFIGGTLALSDHASLLALLMAPPRAVWWLAGDANPIQARATLAGYAVIAAACVFAWVGLVAQAGRPRREAETADRGPRG